MENESGKRVGFRLSNESWEKAKIQAGSLTVGEWCRGRIEAILEGMPSAYSGKTLYEVFAPDAEDLDVLDPGVPHAT